MVAFCYKCRGSEVGIKHWTISKLIFYCCIARKAVLLFVPELCFLKLAGLAFTQPVHSCRNTLEQGVLYQAIVNLLLNWISQTMKKSVLLKASNVVQAKKPNIFRPDQ